MIIIIRWFIVVAAFFCSIPIYRFWREWIFLDRLLGPTFVLPTVYFVILTFSFAPNEMLAIRLLEPEYIFLCEITSNCIHIYQQTKKSYGNLCGTINDNDRILYSKMYILRPIRSHVLLIKLTKYKFYNIYIYR